MESFLHNSGISYSTPGSSDFASARESYSGVHDDKQPSVIVLPANSQQLADTVKKAIDHGIPVVVRGGGHDTFGRFTAAGAVLLDLRKLDSVSIDAENSTARIGGGIIILNLLKVLKDNGFHASTGACGMVGYTGWALAGGLGPFMNSHGVGADQIVGAKVVNAKGNLVEADAGLLKGLRGGGGSLAIVAELVIKIYPLEELQAGLIVHESSDLHKTVTTFYTNLGKLLDETGGRLPRQLHTLPTISPIPGIGIVSGCIVAWKGPADEQFQHWRDRIASLAPLHPALPDAKTIVATTSLYDLQAHLINILPKSVTGRCHTATVTKWTPELIKKVADAAVKMPCKTTGGIHMHMLRIDSPSCLKDAPDAVVPFRTPQTVLEMLGFGQDEESSKETAQWARETRDVIYNSDDAIEGTYLPLTAPEVLDLEKVYGEKWAELRALKAEHDPDGVFKYAVPALP